MKYLIYLTVFLAFCLISLSQPTTISYQGKLLDNVNLPVNQNGVTITFAIYSSQTEGTKLWPPNHSASSKIIDIIQGLYSVTLGTGLGNDEIMTAGLFAGYSPWLEIIVDGSVLPRTPLTNVPFALMSNQLSDDGWASPGELGATNPNSGNFSTLTIGTGTNTYTFPNSKGTENHYLKSNSDGTTSWAAVTPTLSIGQSYQGGIIFWLDATGQHGLIAATTDQSTGIQWYNGINHYLGAADDGLYSGESQTSIIVSSQMSDNPNGNFAAIICSYYSITVDGITYGDWYLPSKYELDLLISKKDEVGGFAEFYYWSSTERGVGFANAQWAPSGEQEGINKNAELRVRAIRSF